MSLRFVVSLTVVVVAVLSARFLFAGLPLRRLARPIGVTDSVVAGVGLAGLAFHCGAMFYRTFVERLPGTLDIIADIRALGTASVIWYCVPAVLVLFGLRRQHPVASAVVALAFAAVGITMFNGGTLRAHLVAIFVAVTILAGIVTTLLLRPQSHAVAQHG